MTYQENIERWKTLVPYNVVVFETVWPIYDKKRDQTTIKYQKTIKRRRKVESVASRQWAEKGDARQRLRDAGFLGGLTIDGSGTYDEWQRETFDYLVNYE